MRGHFLFPCDQDFGLEEMQKTIFLKIFSFLLIGQVMESASVIIMITMVFLTKMKKKLTNPKISANKSKIKWLKYRLHFVYMYILFQIPTQILVQILIFCLIHSISLEETHRLWTIITLNSIF